MTQILFFGALRDAAGAPERAVNFPASISTVAELRAWLSSQDAALGEALSAPGIQTAVDQTLARDDTSISGASEIAFMSPMSGG
ncbi:MAG: molybdopterin converting factor subunit 1 [Hyphomonadaceae bacterium]